MGVDAGVAAPIAPSGSSQITRHNSAFKYSTRIARERIQSYTIAYNRIQSHTIGCIRAMLLFLFSQGGRDNRNPYRDRFEPRRCASPPPPPPLKLMTLGCPPRLLAVSSAAVSFSSEPSSLLDSLLLEEDSLLRFFCASVQREVEVWVDEA